MQLEVIVTSPPPPPPVKEFVLRLTDEEAAHLQSILGAVVTYIAEERREGSGLFSYELYNKLLDQCGAWHERGDNQ